MDAMPAPLRKVYDALAPLALKYPHALQLEYKAAGLVYGPEIVIRNAARTRSVYVTHNPFSHFMVLDTRDDGPYVTGFHDRAQAAIDRTTEIITTRMFPDDVTPEEWDEHCARRVAA